MQMTPQQEQAVRQHGRNLVVVAGAGSGKTRVLVERYLALLDSNPDWPLNALVAITFTRKAAQEMRDRVRQALEERLRSALNDKARAVWAARLASMDSARIDTIHGLCASLLRANAAEAGLDPDFVVLDEFEAGIVLDSALDAALQAALHDPTSGAARLLAEYDPKALRAALEDFIATDLPPLAADLLGVWQAAWEADAAAALDALCADPTFIEAASWQPPGGWPPKPDRLLEVLVKARC
ncbi:MAG: UvrD-helicase domain-containing protein, partial [Aggregatilineales bacterium]